MTTLPGVLVNNAGSFMSAGTANTLNALYSAKSLVSKIGSGGFSLTKGNQANAYTPTVWGSGLGVQQTVMVKSNLGGFFFDAIFSTDTEHGLTITQHPVQTGANISDHAFVNPIRIGMQVGVSDAMGYRYGADYGSDGMTKSVQAYRQLCKLQELRIPMQVVTRLNTYNNMLIESIEVSDDVSTLCAFKANVNLVQVLVVNVGTEKVSARDWTTGAQKAANETSPVEDASTLRKVEDTTGKYVDWSK